VAYDALNDANDVVDDEVFEVFDALNYAVYNAVKDEVFEVFEVLNYAVDNAVKDEANFLANDEINKFKG